MTIDSRRCAPSAAHDDVTSSTARRIALVTPVRARSSSDGNDRGRPPSPVAAARWSTRASSSAWIRAECSAAHAPIGRVELGRERFDPSPVGDPRRLVEQSSRRGRRRSTGRCRRARGRERRRPDCTAGWRGSACPRDRQSRCGGRRTRSTSASRTGAACRCGPRWRRPVRSTWRWSRPSPWPAPRRPRRGASSTAASRSSCRVPAQQRFGQVAGGDRRERIGCRAAGSRSRRLRDDRRPGRRRRTSGRRPRAPGGPNRSTARRARP